MLFSATFSELLGYTSIVCWLGAQFPQVVENARRQSVDGLALPFLMNWLLGDATNLLGCILTRQLPFQTYLATYFCIVDLSLLSQYFYYTYRAAKVVSPPYIHGRERAGTGALGTRRLSIERGTGAPHYRALSTVAANVAAVAALAAQQEEHARRHPRRAHSTEPLSTTYDDDEDVSEDALARLTESFHSEGGRSARRKHVPWGREAFSGPNNTVGRSRGPSRVPTALQMTIPVGETESLARGRPLVRAADLVEDEEEWPSANTQRRSSRASRKGATMVFLAVWALFGVGTFAGGEPLLPTGLVGPHGKVLARTDIPPRVFPEVVIDTRPADTVQLAGEPEVFLYFTNDKASEQPEPGPTMEHTIGRISAWVCTTLYLTSRLPQIWKNYVRKSVEGLSMYLFVFAFLGNVFYVASILSSPNMRLPYPQASAFIRESIPYLLGSGGTLMFDVTIVSQSFLYRGKASARARHMSHLYNEEEAALLSAEATGAEEPHVASRRRGASVSRDTIANV